MILVLEQPESSLNGYQPEASDMVSVSYADRRLKTETQQDS